MLAKRDTKVLFWNGSVAIILVKLIVLLKPPEQKFTKIYVRVPALYMIFTYMYFNSKLWNLKYVSHVFVQQFRKWKNVDGKKTPRMYVHIMYIYLYY